MDIYAITYTKHKGRKHFYLDRLEKYDSDYFWFEPDEVDITELTPVYFIYAKHINDDASINFKQKQLRFMTTVKKIKEKYLNNNKIANANYFLRGVGTSLQCNLAPAGV